jgi:acyl-CoA thioesterase I
MKLGALIVISGIFIYGVSLGVMYSQVQRYQNYWSKRNTRSIESGSVDYVAIGDSTAQGIGAGTPKHSYVEYIAQYLEESSGSKPRVVNLSKTGATIAQANEVQVPQLRTLPISDKTVITVSIGANNINNFEQTRFENDIDELFQALPKQAIVADIPSFTGSRYGSGEVVVEVANRILYAKAQEYGFKLVPLHEKTKANHSLLMLAPDWFHPSARSYKNNWSTVFIERLKVL